MGNKSNKAIIAVLDNPADRDKAKTVFKTLDKNDDGSLDREEWKVFANIVLDKQKKQLKDSGTLSGIKSSGVDKYFDGMFDQADVDHDGKVTFQEFENWLTKFRNATVALKQDLRGSQSGPIYAMTPETKPHTFVVLLTGSINVGKTSIAKQFLQGTFSEQPDLEAMTVHCQSKIVKYGDFSFKLNFRDTCGSERLNTVTASALQGVHIMIICFDLTSRTSYNDVPSRIRDSDMFSPSAHKYLVGTKSDVVSERSVTSNEASEFAASRKMGYLETSAKENKNIDLLFKTVCLELKQKIDEGGEYSIDSSFSD